LIAPHDNLKRAKGIQIEQINNADDLDDAVSFFNRVNYDTVH